MDKARIELRKALQYLDFGRPEQGELCLKRVIEYAESEGDGVTYIRAAVCYGDLLWEAERFGAAESWLRLALDRFDALQPDTDVLDMEVSRARTLLERMGQTR
ncbi:hypothetical protein [Paenibacillus sp. GYB003]|uniref:hypothetical protein n=1 Tax=Paenibacillus sp. GYB003 TaxID=2994392 RepID=UPI002F96421C